MEHWFDRFAKASAGGLSRRQLLQRLGAGVAAAALAPLLPREAIASAPRCAPGETRCPGGVCANLSNDIQNCGACGNACDSPEDLCCDGACTNVSFNRSACGACGNVCPEGFDCCGGQCIDISSDDPNNCGCCGCGCVQTEVCVDGVCQ